MADIDNIIIEVLQGSASKAQLDQLESWIQESPQNDQVYQEILSYWNDGKPDGQAEVHRIWESFLQKQSQDARPNPSQGRIKRNFFRRYRLQIAAAIALLIGTTALWYSFATAEVRFITGFGEKKELVLADQSEVILNANSQLWYRKNQPRKVWLDGEAYFKVSKKPLTKETFQVITCDLKVKVLGTAFNVNSRQEETKVYLDEGKVKLNLKDETQSEVLLDPGELLTYSVKKGKDFEKIRSQSPIYTSWKDGSIILRKIPLQEVLTRMEDIYGIHIKLANKSLESREVTLAIPVEDLAIAIEALESVLGVKILEQEKSEYLIQ